ncbi:winged helix-turn-helix domain-containing protein [Rheinheimera sp. 1928-s]|uniref:winged helix-turn-helix domain-containing protein n=1 Tax=Rheinheimera sp. 1928-s TaxID=3033803 RepID=UPI002604E00A|nr:winged helix-turn-helix domain-containing protein [Rheinheimera sp. 1928-s]MDF3123915.1 winged helix-turn-helix domain-containing protein [Rheinheimera sp. 1928-s]
MSFRPEKQLKVEEWWYLPQLDKLAKLNDRMEVSEVADLDHLCQSVLNFFLLNSGRLISKEELLREVWRMTSVTDGRVARVISILRDVLGDDVKSPRYIETIPKRGYRFIAKVIEQEQQIALASDGQDEPQSAAERKVNRIWWAALTVSTLLLGLLASWIFWPSSSAVEEQAPFVNWSPVSSLDGFEYYPAISNDKNFLVYSYQKDKNHSNVLMLQNLQTHQTQQLTDSDSHDFGASFRPDGKAIAYQRIKYRELCEIRLLSFAEDSAQSVVEDKLLTSCGLDGTSTRISWAPDGRSLLFGSNENNAQRMSIFSLDIASGTKTQLVLPSNSGIGDFTARYSHGGDKIAFLRDVASNSVQIWIMDLNSRETSLLLHLKHSYPGDLAWSHNDEFIYYPARKWNIESVNINTAEQQTVALTNNHAYEIALGGDGEFYGSIGRYGNYYIKKFNNPITNPTASEEIVFKSNRSERLVEANPAVDGPTAAVSMRTGLPQIWLFYPNGRQEMISQFESSVVISDMEFSGDGKQLLVLIDQEVWLFNLAGKSKKISAKGEVVKNLSWGQQTNNVFYTVNNKGNWQVMSYQLDKESQTEVYLNGVDLFVQSKGSDHQLKRLALTGDYILFSGEGEVLLNANTQDLMFAESSTFVLRENGIYFSAVNDKQQSQLFFYSYKEKAIYPLDLVSDLYSSRFSLSHDGQYIYMVIGESQDLDIAKFELKTTN